jgi:hypothetical protein
MYMVTVRRCWEEVFISLVQNAAHRVARPSAFA